MTNKTQMKRAARKAGARRDVGRKNVLRPAATPKATHNVLSTHESYMPYLYAAYGMNTSMAGMFGRCPMARAVGVVTLRGHHLVFRGVADVAPARGRAVELALWQITDKCERALDRLEGYQPSGRGLYDKRWFLIEGDGPLAGQRAMIYVMTDRDWVSAPAAGYEHMLREGYTDFGMPHEQINRAIREASRGRARTVYSAGAYETDY